MVTAEALAQKVAWDVRRDGTPAGVVRVGGLLRTAAGLSGGVKRREALMPSAATRRRQSLSTLRERACAGFLK